MPTRDTLRSVLEAGRTGKRLDELSAARVLGKVAAQLHAAQQKAGAGKAIGPITPAMVVLAPDGSAQLELGDAGHALGYTAPERLTGGAGDRRSDLFSLGVLLWEALTHERLFEAMNDAAVRVAVGEREIKPPVEVNANVPAELSAICMRALSRNPADRYGSAKAMGVELEEFLAEAGYPDSDEKIATFLGELHAPPPAPPSLPPIEQVAAFAPPVAPPAEPAPASAGPVPDPAPAAAPPAAADAPAAAEPALLAPRPPILPAGDSPRATIASAVPPPPAPPPSAKDTIPDGQVVKPDDASPQPVASVGSSPHPASIVSLPGRDSRTDMLASWAWQTDSHDAIPDDDYDQPESKKPLVYLIGGGIAAAAIVTIIAVGFGGSSKKKDKPKPAAAAMMASSAPGSAAPAVAPAPVAPAPAPAAIPDPPAPAPQGSATDTTQLAAGSGSDSGSASAPDPTPPPAPAPAQVATPTPPPPSPAAEPKHDHEPKVTHTEPKAHKPKGQLADPFGTKRPERVARAEHEHRSETSTKESETAYRVGLQQFARGDTSGALASLRTALASNPNYPPTWRGLGLVFEKLGEKDQARAAFRRYLQLAPKAGDADQIRSRLERLGS